MKRSEPIALLGPRTGVHEGVLAQWPALAAGGSLFASPGWLRAMHGRLGGRTVTVAVDGGGAVQVAALASVQPAPRPEEFFDLHHVLVSPAPALPLTPAARAARARLAATAPDSPQWTPNLVVMLPGYECVPVGPAADQPPALDRLVDTAVGWARGAGLRAVAFLYTRPEAVALSAVLTDRGFVAVPLTHTWDLAVPAGGLPGYLETLPRKRRAEAVRELARLDQAGVRLRHLDPAEATSGPVLRTLAGLRSQLVGKYRGHADLAEQLSRLERLAYEVAGGRPQVFTAEAGPDTVGFALFAGYGDAWHCLAVGYDYTDPRSRLAYFGTAFYAAAAAASEAGVRQLGYGQGSAHAKSSRGCAGTPLTGWFLADDPALMAAARTAAEVTELLPG